MTVDRLQPKMRDAALFKWKDVAWNGIRFTAPEKWEAAKIGARHLLLEEAARPTMELKWRRIRGKFSHHKLLRRLAALHPDRLPADLAEWDLPPQWQSALVNFNASGFRWHGKAFRGRGVILYCPACQTATLIQFYHRNGSENDPVCHQVLGSFRDHFQGEPTMWSLFDIRACLPSRFELTSFRFDAGHFFLKFAARGQTLVLNRWGPASILLSGRDLLQLARALNQVPSEAARMQLMVGDRQIEGVSGPSLRRWFPTLTRLATKPAFQQFRLWHLVDKNRIFGLNLQSKTPFDRDEFDRLCAAYESL